LFSPETTRQVPWSRFSEETAVDYELTAKIATDAFAFVEGHFSAERIKWLYERSFGRGTTVLAAHDDGRKIGYRSR